MSKLFLKDGLISLEGKEIACLEDLKDTACCIGVLPTGIFEIAEGIVLIEDFEDEGFEFVLV